MIAFWRVDKAERERERGGGGRGGAEEQIKGTVLTKRQERKRHVRSNLRTFQLTI